MFKTLSPDLHLFKFIYDGMVLDIFEISPNIDLNHSLRLLELPETPEGLDAAENPIRLPSNVHLNQAEFS